MTTPGTSVDSDPGALQNRWHPPPKSDHVAVFVHGIGDQRHAATLTEWGDPLLDWLAEVGGNQVRVHITETVPAGIGDQPAWVRGELVSEDATASFTLVEATWADLVEEPPFGRLVGWAIQVLPATLIDQLRGMIRRRWHRMVDSRKPATGRVLAGVSWLLLSLLGSLLALLLVPLVLVVLILTLIVGILGVIFPGAGDAATAVQRAMSMSVGDVLVFSGSQVRQSMIVSRVRGLIAAAADWHVSPDPVVAVLAHSQGTEVTRRALELLTERQAAGTGITPFTVRWFTFGQALDKAQVMSSAASGILAASLWAVMSLAAIVVSGAIGDPQDVIVGLAFATVLIAGPLAVGWAIYGLASVTARVFPGKRLAGERAEQSRRRRVAAVAAVLYVAGYVLVAITNPVVEGVGERILAGALWPIFVWFQIPAVNEFGNSGTGWSILAAFVGYVPMFFVGRNVFRWLRQKPQAVPTPGCVETWVDVASVADPVPNGEPATGVEAGGGHGIVTHNTGSMLRDHTTYWHNRNHFLPYAALTIFGDDTCARLNVTRDALEEEGRRRRYAANGWRLAWWLSIPVTVVLAWRLLPVDLALGWTPPFVPTGWWDPVVQRPREAIVVLGVIGVLGLVHVARSRHLLTIERRYLSSLVGGPPLD